MKLTEAQIKYMVFRFLSYKFPSDMKPDGGLKLERPAYMLERNEMPTGTNLLDATQARAMIDDMIKGLPDACAPSTS